MQEISNYIGIILGFLSIIATAFFAHIYSERKSPKLTYQTTKKIQRSKDDPEDIEVLYKGKKVDSIHSTIIWFWNDGRKPIVCNDIPDSQPIQFTLESNKEVEILDVSVLKASREVIGCLAHKCAADKLELKFEFLDYHDGFAVEILHTGSGETNIKTSGTILGAPNGINCVAGKGGSHAVFLDTVLLYPRRKRKTLSEKLLLTAVFTLLFGGLTYISLSFPTEITTTKELLSKSLSGYISSESLDEAVDKVIENSKYKFIQLVMPYLMSGIFLINMLFGYWVTWAKRYPYPKSIANFKDSKELKI